MDDIDNTLKHAASLAESLAPLINNEKFSDVTFVVGDEGIGGSRQICASRNILAARSPVFEKMLYGPMLEAQQKDKDIEILGVTPEAFMIMLNYIYTDKVNTLGEENVVETLSCANRFLVAKLSKACMKYIQKHLSTENVCKFMTQGRRDPSLVEVCTKYIGRNGDKVFASLGFTLLPKELVVDLLKSDDLSVSSELKVFQGCYRWAKENTDEKEAQSRGYVRAVRNELRDVIPHIRFPVMSKEELILEVEPTGVLDAKQIFQVLRFLVKGGDEEIHFKNDPRKIYVDNYTYDFDKNGVVYYLGTKHLTQPFINPHLGKDISLTVRISSIGDQGRLRDIVSRVSSHTWTSSDDHQWICIDLGPNTRLMPTRYTLRHGCDNGEDEEEDDYIRNWCFEASVDGNEWTILRQHTGDCSISGPYDTSTWALSHKNRQRVYRTFRIRSTGLNSSDDHCMVICGMELYGELYLKNTFGAQEVKQ